MKMELICKTNFDAAHKLEGYNGACANLHGHRWNVEFRVTSDKLMLDEIGMLVDFKKLKDLTKAFDHTYLNQIFAENPTAENLAIFFQMKAKKLVPKECKVSVKIFETLENSVEVSD